MGPFVETMFDRADVDDDGVISSEEVGKLGPRGLNLKPPITKEQYYDWVTSRMESGQRSAGGFPRSGFRRPAAPSQAGRRASDKKAENSEPEPEKKEKDAGDSDGK